MSDGRWYETAIGKMGCALLALGASVLILSGAFAAGTQRNFASPEEATQALVQAVKAQDRPATLAVLGQDASSWISSGDAPADRAKRRQGHADARHR
jgi:hypothetical protein